MKLTDEQQMLQDSVARLMADGTVVGATGELIAYIEHDGTVGDAKQEYLGEVTAPGHGATDNMGYVTRPGADDDSKDELVALVDYGRGVVRDAQGSTVAEIGRGGDVLGRKSIDSALAFVRFVGRIALAGDGRRHGSMPNAASPSARRSLSDWRSRDAGGCTFRRVSSPS